MIISCIIPTKNRSGLLSEAIYSIVNQTYKDWELIIVDDGSTDNTHEVCKDFSDIDSRIKYFKNPGRGGAAARNYGISKSAGEYIAFLDDDDISLPHRFESQLYAARKTGNKFIVSGYQVRNRENGKLISRPKLKLKGEGAGFPSRWFIHRQLLEKTGGFDENFPAMQDIELSYRLSEFETFALHNSVVSIIYPTKNSVSTNTENTLKGRELLMQKLCHKMHPKEAAWWYFTIAMDYYRLNDRLNGLRYLKISSELNSCITMKFAYQYAKIFTIHSRVFDVINRKILYRLGNRFPVLVEHPVI